MRTVLLRLRRVERRSAATTITTLSAPPPATNATHLCCSQFLNASIDLLSVTSSGWKSKRALPPACARPVCMCMHKSEMSTSTQAD
eukprot:1140074-Pelagomonas_calceolata.AAC.2